MGLKEIVQAMEEDAAARLDEIVRALERLAREAVAELGSARRPQAPSRRADIRIEVDPADGDLMRRIVQALGIKAEIAGSLSALGGLRASAADGSISVVNTIEARLERAREELRQKLAALLSTEEVSWRMTEGTGTQTEGGQSPSGQGDCPP